MKKQIFLFYKKKKNMLENKINTAIYSLDTKNIIESMDSNKNCSQICVGGPNCTYIFLILNKKKKKRTKNISH